MADVHLRLCSRWKLLCFATSAISLLTLHLLYSGDSWEGMFRFQTYNFCPKIWNSSGRPCFQVLFHNKTLDGKKFELHLDQLKILDDFRLLTSNTQLPSDYDVFHSEPAFISAISENHLPEMRDLLKSFDEFFRFERHQKLILYDLGLKCDPSQLGFPGRFEIRRFPFEKYPKFVGKLTEYRWKPLIIAEALKQFSSIWWLDSSVRFPKPNVTLKNRIRNFNKSGAQPVTLFSSAGHSIFQATHPKMYQYFPLPENVSKSTVMYGATYMLMYGTKKMKKEILLPWVACALDCRCMAPIGSNLYCTFRGEHKQVCHRFDQSAINLILALLSEGDTSKYAATETAFYRSAQSTVSRVLSHLGLTC